MMQPIWKKVTENGATSGVKRYNTTFISMVLRNLEG